jgi:hypothetical protein
MECVTKYTFDTSTIGPIPRGCRSMRICQSLNSFSAVAFFQFALVAGGSQNTSLSPAEGTSTNTGTNSTRYVAPADVHCLNLLPHEDGQGNKKQPCLVIGSDDNMVGRNCCLSYRADSCSCKVRLCVRQ